MPLVPAILCGGAGSRLWPVSRELHPKPFIRLADGESLLQKAFLRAARLPGVAQVLTVTNRELFFATRDEYREVDSRNEAVFILEPFGRGTAAAVACAALRVEQLHGRDAQLLVLPADHLISQTARFTQAVQEASAIAAKGNLVTFGIKPSHPETGYGYIEAEGNRVLRFVEKPAFEKARQYVQAGNFLWNSGMFCFAAGTVIDEMARHCPEILEAARDCVSRSRATEDGAALELEAESFARVPDNSIDYALMEKSSRVAVVPCDIGWSDIGSWTAIRELTEPDRDGNRIEGESVLHDVRDSYIRGGHRMVGAVGLTNVVIVDTPDALLVADASRAQDVKQIYTRLKEQGHEAHKLHRTVHRPWGMYTVIEEGPGFKIKRIEVKPGASLSLQMHQHRSEHWIVVSGTAQVVNGDREFTVNTNESTFIPPRNKHRLSNPHNVELVIIEVQSGPYLGEDDITRFDDKYGRVPVATR